uniref:Uncharacterized protein n=1 Tax=Glossina palpalis gambiensis TaxID=67801 RepID=A0A1B0BWK9_9MUSC
MRGIKLRGPQRLVGRRRSTRYEATYLRVADFDKAFSLSRSAFVEPIIMSSTQNRTLVYIVIMLQLIISLRGITATPTKRSSRAKQ